MKKTGILIGRFQVDELPPTLVQIIERIRDDHDVMGIIIGVTKVLGSKMNPLDFQLRQALLLQQYPEAKIFPLDDMPSDELWSRQLDQLVEEKFAKDSVHLFGSQDGFAKKYSGKFPANPIGMAAKLKVDPEKMRAAFGDAADFRRGVIYGAHNTYPKVYPTVDIALFKENRKQLLMGMKNNDKKWRLIGGFTDPTDESYEEAVKRELQEESGIEQVSSLKYERSFRIDDWRYRHEEDKIISCLFSAEFISGEPKGSDDLAEVKWILLDDVKTLKLNKQTAPEHDPLLNYLLEKYSGEAI